MHLKRKLIKNKLHNYHNPGKITDISSQQSRTYVIDFHCRDFQTLSQSVQKICKALSYKMIKTNKHLVEYSFTYKEIIKKYF